MTLLDPGNELHTLIEEYGYQRWREGFQQGTPGAQATADAGVALSALLSRFRGILEDLADDLEGDIKETVALAQITPEAVQAIIDSRVVAKLRGPR